MYHIGGVFIKEKGLAFYKTIEREIADRINKKKDLKEQTHKQIALIISLTAKDDHNLLSALTLQAIEDYR